MLILLYISLLSPLLLSSSKLHSPKPQQPLLSQLQENLSNLQGPLSNTTFQAFISTFFSTTSSTLNKTLLSKALTIYAKLLLYGQTPSQEISIPKAVYFLKLASSLGCAEAQYMESWLSFYKLDGTLALEENSKDLKLHKSSDSEILRLAEYIRKRSRVNSLISAYFPALQNHTQASVAMAYKYLQGLHLHSDSTTSLLRNCPSAALYYHEVNKQIYLDHESFIPKFIEKKRLMLETLDAEIQGSINDDHEHLEFLLMQAKQSKIEALLKLAYYYFYGLRGVAKNYEKAFEYFSHAAHLGDVSAKTSLGYMYMKGLGVTKSHSKAYKEFNEAALRKDPRAKCGLGTLYMSGYGVEKNEKLGLSYFKEAADIGNAEGQYLYGSHILASNTKNLMKQGVEYLNLAAHQGHAAAMYALALLHLDGNNIFYSCEVAVDMMRHASERGSWSDLMKKAQYALRNRDKKLSVLLYFEASFLGISNSHHNSAVLLDKFEVFSQKDLDFSALPRLLRQDPVFLSLTAAKNEPFFEKSALHTPLDFLFEDLMQTGANSTFLPRLLSVETLRDVKKTNRILAINSYELSSKENDAFAFLRIGDFFYYGLLEQQTAENFLRAADFYSKVLDFAYEENYMAQACFNLAYMYQYGLGVRRDFNKSWSLYNKTYELNKYSLFSVRVSQLLLSLQRKLHENQGDDLSFAQVFAETLLPSVGTKDLYAAVVGFSLILWGICEILRLRQKNLLESLKE